MSDSSTKRSGLLAGMSDSFGSDSSCPPSTESIFSSKETMSPRLVGLNLCTARMTVDSVVMSSPSCSSAAIFGW